MRNVFDHLGQTIGFSALNPCGLTVLEDRLAPNARRADIRHEPDPALAGERELLGLLGRIASILCLIELYSGALDEDDALACLTKLIAFRQERQRWALKKRKEMEILIDLEQVLGTKPSPTPEEEEFVVSMRGTWRDARRIGRTGEAAQAVLTVFRVRGFIVPEVARERILAEKGSDVAGALA